MAYINPSDFKTDNNSLFCDINDLIKSKCPYLQAYLNTQLLSTNGSSPSDNKYLTKLK